MPFLVTMCRPAAHSAVPHLTGSGFHAPKSSSTAARLLLTSLDPLTGRVRWRQDLGLRDWETPAEIYEGMPPALPTAVTDGIRIYVWDGPLDYRLRAYDVQDGQLLWTSAINEHLLGDVELSPQGNYLFADTGYDSSGVVFDVRTGAEMAPGATTAKREMTDTEQDERRDEWDEEYRSNVWDTTLDVTRWSRTLTGATVILGVDSDAVYVNNFAPNPPGFPGSILVLDRRTGQTVARLTPEGTAALEQYVILGSLSNGEPVTVVCDGTTMTGWLRR